MRWYTRPFKKEQTCAEPHFLYKPNVRNILKKFQYQKKKMTAYPKRDFSIWCCSWYSFFWTSAKSIFCQYEIWVNCFNKCTLGKRDDKKLKHFTISWYGWNWDLWFASNTCIFMQKLTDESSDFLWRMGLIFLSFMPFLYEFPQLKATMRHKQRIFKSQKRYNLSLNPQLFIWDRLKVIHINYTWILWNES